MKRNTYSYHVHFEPGRVPSNNFDNAIIKLCKGHKVTLNVMHDTNIKLVEA